MTTSTDKEAKKEWLDTDGKIVKPTLGMVFLSIEELFRYYSLYAQQEGFGVVKTTRKLRANGDVRNQVLQCRQGLKSRNSEAAVIPCPPSNKTECDAKLRASRLPDGSFKLSTVVLEHNHDLSPGKVKVRVFRRRYAPTRLESNGQAGMRVHKDYRDDSRSQRYNKLCNKFLELASIVCDDDEKYNMAMNGLCDLMDIVKTGVERSLNHQANQHSSVAPPRHVHLTSDTPTTTTKVLSPLPIQQKGPPPTTTKDSKVDDCVPKSRNKKREADDGSNENKRQRKEEQLVNNDKFHVEPPTTPSSMWPQSLEGASVVPSHVTTDALLMDDGTKHVTNDGTTFSHAVPSHATNEPHLPLDDRTTQDTEIVMGTSMKFPEPTCVEAPPHGNNPQVFECGV